MRTFLKYFSIAFVLFGCVGVFVGLKTRHEERPVQLVIRESVYPKLEGGKLELRISCGGHDVWTFIPADGGGKQIDFKYHPGLVPTFTERVESSFFWLLGSAGFGVAKIANQPVSETLRSMKLAGLIVGGVSGFGIGYALGSKAPLDCARDDVYAALQSTEAWKNLMPSLWHGVANRKLFYDGDTPFSVGDLRVVGPASLALSDNNVARELIDAQAKWGHAENALLKRDAKEEDFKNGIDASREIEQIFESHRDAFVKDGRQLELYELSPSWL